MRKSLFVVISYVFFAISCNTSKNIVRTNKPESIGLKKENKYTLMSRLKEKKFNFKWLNAHFTMDIDKDSSHDSFSGTVRIKKDSLIWMNISALDGALTIARVLLNQDSVMFIDYHDEKYIKGNYDYIDSLLREDIDFELIHSVMVGSSMEFYADTSKMNAYFDGKDYILSTVRKRKIKRLMYRNKPLHTKNDAQLIWLDSKDFHIKKIRLEDFINHRVFEASYDDFQQVDSVTFPTHIHYEINAEKTISIDLKYKRINFTDKEKAPFTIPRKYEQIQY